MSMGRHKWICESGLLMSLEFREVSGCGQGSYSRVRD
jgi:hypothetical protein